MIAMFTHYPIDPQRKAYVNVSVRACSIDNTFLYGRTMVTAVSENCLNNKIATGNAVTKVM